jgi:hypothetical protein
VPAFADDTKSQDKQLNPTIFNMKREEKNIGSLVGGKLQNITFTLLIFPTLQLRKQISCAEFALQKLKINVAKNSLIKKALERWMVNMLNCSCIKRSYSYHVQKQETYLQN